MMFLYHNGSNIVVNNQRKQSGVTWREKVKYVGFAWIAWPSDRGFKVRLSYNPGRVSFGDARSLDEAIANAARGMAIDWGSVERKITESHWKSLAHL